MHSEASILNVDDHETSRYIRSRILRQAGFEVEEAVSGADALARVMAAAPGLVLLDVNLPDMSGFEVCRRIKADPHTASTLVLHLTATCYASQDKVRGLETGAAGYLTEPVEPEVLIATIRALMREHQSEQQVKHLAALVQSSEDAIFSKTLDGVILTWNSGAERVYGWSAGEVLGKHVSLLYSPEGRGELDEIMDMLRRGERIENRETVRLRKDGSLVPVALTVSPVRDETGRIQAASIIARDISERRRFEEQLRAAQKYESLGVLAGGIAHDFNNLLTGILGNASLALDRLAPASPMRRELGQVITAGERAAQLTRQLLAYAGKGGYSPRRLELSTLIRASHALLETALLNQVELRLELGEDLPPVEADAGQMQQLLVSLVRNGAEAIPPDGAGVVTVRTAYAEVREGGAGIKPGSWVTLEVSDTGTGMDAATRARIFDPFFTTKFLGRGLGLAAVSGIVRVHQGLITVESAPGAGSTFRVWLPALVGTSTAAVPAPVVLVVDDEEIVRHAAQAALERNGFQVLVADGGHRAVELFRERAADIAVVLLDLTMPGMCGDQTAPQLKAIRPDVPILASSGYDEALARERFPRNGLTGFIRKPYTATQLAERIRSLLQVR